MFDDCKEMQNTCKQDKKDDNESCVNRPELANWDEVK